MSIKRKFTTKDQNCNECMLRGSFKTQGYDWWWHSFTAINRRTGAEKPFFIEFFVCNPALAEDEPVLGQLPANQTLNKKPSYLMVNCGCWGADKKKQLHRFFAWKDVKIHMNAPYSVQAADCYADEYTLRGTVALTEEEVEEFCKKLPRYKRPRKIIFADIPRNPTGKIEKPTLRKIYCGDSVVASQVGE